MHEISKRIKQAWKNTTFSVKTEQVNLTLYKPEWQQIKNLPFGLL